MPVKQTKDTKPKKRGRKPGQDNKALTPQDSPDNSPDIITPRNSPKPKCISIDAILELKAKGLSHAEVGKLLGCSAPNICQRLKDHEIQSIGLDTFRKTKAEKYTKIQRDLICALNVSDTDLDDPEAIVRMLERLQKMERLERGESTSNIAHAQVDPSQNPELKQLLDAWKSRQLAPDVDSDTIDAETDDE